MTTPESPRAPFDHLDDAPQRRDASWLGALLFSSGDHVFRLSQQRPLDFGDLLPLRDADATATCYAQFIETYKRHGRSLPRAMAFTYGRAFALCGLGSLFVAANGVFAPVVVHHVVSAFGRETPDVANLSLWLATFVVLRIVSVVVSTHVECAINHMALRLTAAMKSLLFRKALRRDRKVPTTSELANLVTSDTNGVLYAVLAAHNAWILPLQIAVITVLLYRELDVAAFAGVGVVVASLSLNYGIARVMGSAYAKLMQAKDTRMHTVKDAFSAIQVVKFNAWEPRFHAKLTTERAAEVARLRVYSYASAASAFVLWSTPFFVSTVSFAVYALVLDRSLSAAKVFTSMALFNALRDPLRDLPTTIQSLIQSRVSIQRLERFLSAPDLDDTRSFRPQAKASSPAIHLEHASFAWQETLVLDDMDLTIQHGDFVVISGPVGAGKSSLLSAFLGELSLKRGRVSIEGRVAYYAQQPWLQHLTIRDNILFGTPFDPVRYHAVLDACCLGPDLARLDAGDATELGEKGVNLSGGQQARIALARACYADADILLLDAPLAAVDVVVQQRIFEQCLCGLLRHKTVVLVTHNPAIVASPFVNVRVALERGRIVSRERSASAVVRGTNWHPAPLDVIKPSAAMHRLVEDEAREDGTIAMSVIAQYVRASGGIAFVAVLVLAQLAWQGFQIGSDVWLSHWTNRPIDRDRVSYFTSVYASLAMAGAAMVLLRGVVIARMGLVAATTLFAAMTDGLLHAPIRFFHANPIGRLLTRYADDVATIDVTLPTVWGTLLSALFSTLGALATAAWTIQYVGLGVLPIIFLYSRIAKGYVRTFCDVRRMLKVVNAPILSHMTQSDAGAAVLRAFGADYVTRAIDENHKRIDVDNALWDTEIILIQWFALRLQWLGCALVALVVASFVACASWFSPGTVGLAFTYALSIDASLLTLLKAWSKAENAMVSVERVLEYSNVEREGDASLLTIEPPASWPQDGAITFDAVSFAYDARDAPVLHDVSFTIHRHEKIGIVGRTGAGKSSLAMALVRMNELAAGRILIDGRDVASVPLRTLRSRIAIIPQSPVLLDGSLRHFLDPFHDASDDKLLKMLGQVEMLAALEAMDPPDGNVLSLRLEANGDNFSVGERQLLCVARALLRQCAIVILDEATAAMDHATEAKVARMMQRALAHVTQLTIAHRVATVLDCDRILVLDNGRVVAFEPPATLLQDPTSLVHAHAAGSRKQAVE